MNKRLIEVAEAIARSADENCAENDGVIYFRTFHAAITVLVDLPEFEPECAVSGEVNFDVVSEALLRDLEPIYAASDAINGAPKYDPDFDEVTSITEKPANPDKWREWQRGELPVPGMQVYRHDKGNSVFSSGFAYEVVTVSRDGGINIRGDDGVMRFIVTRRVLEEFRPAI